MANATNITFYQIIVKSFSTCHICRPTSVSVISIDGNCGANVPVVMHGSLLFSAEVA